jgi:hypothetical protein
MRVAIEVKMAEGWTHRSDSGTPQNVILAYRHGPPWEVFIQERNRDVSYRVNSKLKMDG